MIELPIYELSPDHLLVIAFLFIIILLGLMVDRYLEEKRDRNTLDKIEKDIIID